MDTNNLIGTATKLDTFLKIMQRLLIACLIAATAVVMILTVVNRINPDVVIGDDFNIIELGPVRLEVAPEYAPGNAGVLAYSWIVVALGYTSGLVIYFCMKYTRNILAPIMLGNPFHEDAAKNVKKLAWVVLVMGITRNIVKIIGTLTVIKQWNLENLSQVEAIRSVGLNVDLETHFLMIFLGLLLISAIFRYGAGLQQNGTEKDTK